MAQEQANPAQLRDMISLIDNHSQDGFNAIAAVASLALLALESPAGYGAVQDIAAALVVIRDRAEQCRDIITSEAESVGCRWKDEPEWRRIEAHFSHVREIQEGRQTSSGLRQVARAS